jgi:hypothetical protein
MGYNGHHHRSDVAARRIKATKLLILVGRTYHHCLPIVKKGKHSERFNWQRDPLAAGLQKHSPHVVLVLQRQSSLISCLQQTWCNLDHPERCFSLFSQLCY